MKKRTAASAPKLRRGFASMDPARALSIQRRGGLYHTTIPGRMAKLGSLGGKTRWAKVKKP